MNNYFPQYTTDYISGVMSLRKPQIKSLKILEQITTSVSLRKDANLKAALGAVHAMYPICTDFEREFLSLTFALATGVGKTRLMGAFIAYLYTQHNIKNFFVVAPNTTIYDKLKRDLSDISSSKYVFKGLGCFSTAPQIIADDDYREKTLSLFESDIHIFVFNIDKFNKEDANMKKVNEFIGDSFYQFLSNLPDLVLIMDESHHYRAEKGAQALNDLHPLLGLELTATPLVSIGTKQIPFKNVVYEYPLSKAIEDGYTRTPFAITRSDIDFYNFSKEQLDKMMLLDGIACHENTKQKLKLYADNHDKPVIKPFMLVVCKDTDHAKWVENFVKSDEFRGGVYRNKTITVHSKQRGAESDMNTRLLLDVENPENPVEIVIHVNMLKEGWDVNNLYTIVPLRTAASKILREQMVGRGLRLPYGERTKDTDVDAVMLTAHDKFNDILAEAQRGDSIFKAGNIIKAEEIVPEQVVQTQLTLDLEPDKELAAAYVQTNIEKSDIADELFQKASVLINQQVTQQIQSNPTHTITPVFAQQIVETVKEQIVADKDLGDTFKDNEMPLTAWLRNKTEETHRAAEAKFIPIPRIKITDAGVEEYTFVDFDLDMTDFTHVPIKNELLVQNLEDMQDRKRIKGNVIDFEGYNPQKVILDELRKKPEIDYEKCSVLLFKLITQLCHYYEQAYGTNGMQNIVMMFKRDISNKIYAQMMQHFYCENGFLQEEVIGTRNYNLQQSYGYIERVGLFENYTEKIQSVLFEKIKKGVFNTAKFDSHPELLLARVLEVDDDVQNWLRPAAKEFNITYNHGRNYEPDFVVETENVIFLVEVKGEDKLKDPDVISKKKRAIKYCDVASHWGKANGYKEWQYLFIPSKQVMPNSSFMQLAKRFREL
ncbi:DEAD/DEAH box helicase [Enterocloster clostridioformis]|uniref:DEAD/DEAH box helicase n=3 Tax=Enterocloster clostridioformis TaxID=1531 RepID=UPI0018AABA89|nr:DEAD/DEAH box helicase family protein [Enterocloster clostridioformis]MDU1963007.1 DEAD/DEAH box helicase family protein [Enterocloster clostridioformis]